MQFCSWKYCSFGRGWKMFKVLALLLALAIAAHAAPAAEVEDQIFKETVLEPEVSSDKEWRIVGGSNAGTTEAPYQVSLRSAANSHFCGGSILSSRTILSAAHCTVGRTIANTIVVVGTVLLNSGGTRYATSRITNHASYNSNTLANDISLVITSTAITGSTTVASIGISSSTVGSGVSVKLTGWGTTSYPGSVPNALQTITLSTLTVADCQSRLSSIGSVFSTQVCTFTRSGQGACHGDSGGPLVSSNVQVGVVSWGAPCAIGYPDVFTRVSSYVAWIQANAG